MQLSWAVPQVDFLFLFISCFKLLVIFASSSQSYLQTKWIKNCLRWLKKISRVPKKVIFFSKDNKDLLFLLRKDRENTTVQQWDAKINSMICIANKYISARVFIVLLFRIRIKIKTKIRHACFLQKMQIYDEGAFVSVCVWRGGGISSLTL